MKMQNLNKIKPVIISGGGIGGLTLANCLKISKIPYVLLEKAPEFKEVGGGIGLWGTALKALRAIEIEDNLLEKGRMMVSAGYRRSDQIDKGEWLVRPSSILRRHTSCLTLKRADLLYELYHGVSDDGNIKNGVQVVSFNDNIDHVNVKLQTGETLEGSLLIGADGINSVIRNSLFPEAAPMNTGYHYWQGITTLDDIMVEKGYSIHGSDLPAYEAWHPGMRFGVVALKFPYIFWFLASDENINPNMSKKEGLIDKCEPFGKKIRHMIESTDESMITKHDLRDIKKMKRWTKGRVALLGDAVHAMAPNLAQGAVLAIEDALELGSQIYKISEYLDNNLKIDKAFRDYESARINRAFVVQTLVPLVHAVGSADRLAPFRDTVFKFYPEFISTPVFDTTHRLSLGWTYTAPNLGQGLYYRLLGKTFINKNPNFKTFHSFDQNRYCSGTVSATRGKGLSILIANILGLPKEVSSGLVELKVETDKTGREIWLRNFKNSKGELTSTFNTTQDMFEEDLIEFFKFFYFIFETKINPGEDDRFYFILKQAGIKFGKLKIKFPKFLCPRVNAVTTSTEKGWVFETRIRSSELFDSLVGEILTYRGDIKI